MSMFRLLARPSAGSIVASAAWLSVAGGALAQVVVPAPGPAPATPAYEPPAAAPTPPAPPPAPPKDPPVAVPDLVQRGADGKVVEIMTPTDETALAALKLDDAKKGLREQVVLERRALLQRVLAKNFKSALKLRGLLKNLDNANDLGELMTYGDATRAVQLNPGLIQNMLTAGAITAAEAEAANKAVTAYTTALTKQINETFAGDRAKSGPVMARVNIRRLTLEPMRELRAMLLAGAANWGELKSRLVFDAPADKEAAVARAANDDARFEAMVDLISAMPEAVQTAVLEGMAMPLPEKRLLPDPRPGPGAQPAAGSPAAPKKTP